MARLVRSLDAAAAFVERVGIAVVFPQADLVLPSLWEAIAGRRPLEWAQRDDGGKFVKWSSEFERLWSWKDELPGSKLACAGKHACRPVALLAPDVVAPLYALTGRPGRADDFRALDLAPLQRDVAEIVLEHGPCGRPQIRELLGGAERKRVEAAIDALQRQLVLTSAGVVEQEHGWPAIQFDVLARRWRARLRRLPNEGDARRRLAERVLAAAAEVSAADLAAALGWRRRAAADVLDELADLRRATVRDEVGIRLWSAR